MDRKSGLIFLFCLPGVFALDEGLTGLIVAGVIAGGLLVVGLISLSVYCFVKTRPYDDDSDSVDIIATKGITPKYHRFPPTVKFRSLEAISTRPRPPVTFFTLRNDPRAASQIIPAGTPYLFEPRGPVLYMDQDPHSNRSSMKERQEHYRRSTKIGNGHVANGSVKIREVQSGEENLTFESSEDENGNKRKSEHRSRSKSRDRKYIRNPDHKNHHRYQNSSGHEKRSRSNSRNRVEHRHSINSNTIVAQPGDIILNPSNFEMPAPKPHSLSKTIQPESSFVPIARPTSLSQSERPTASSVFVPFDIPTPLETPREDYLTPRSATEMPSTIQPETPRSDLLNLGQSYPRNSDFVYPPKPDKKEPRPPTPEFDADSILYGTKTQVVRPPSPPSNIYESTPRPPTPPAPPPPPPHVGSQSADYLNPIHRPPTPVAGILDSVNNKTDDDTNQASTSHDVTTKRPSLGVTSPMHSAMMAEIKSRRQRRPSDDSSIGLPPSSSVERSPSPERRRSPSPEPRSLSDNRRPSGVQFTEHPPEIIPRGLEAESPDYEPGSVSRVFDSIMNSGGAPSSSEVPAPPPPPPPPPVPSFK